MRDDFKQNIKNTVAARSGYRCSNPNCTKTTSGPQVNNEKAISIGVAAHITAASPGGARYDDSLKNEQRSSIENAIWLCQSCSVLVDRDPEKFTVEILKEWKSQAENRASIELASNSQFRTIAISELRQEHTLGELVTLQALREEFGCEIRTNISVPTDNGWLNLDAAVVRGEDLIAIEIRENKENQIPYFQVEYLLELGEKLKFQRFKNFVLWIAVISNRSSEEDEIVRKRLEQIKDNTLCEVNIRMYRLNPLRAKFGL